jgi:hypothetical protein
LLGNDRGIFTEPLPSNGKGDTHTDTQTDESDFLIRPLRWAQVPSFIKIGSGIQQLIGTDTDSNVIS